MSKKVKTLDRALRALFPKTYKGLKSHIIRQYEYDMYGDPYEGYDDLHEDEREEPALYIDDEDYEAWQARNRKQMDEVIIDMHNEEIVRLDEERRKAHVERLCADDPSLIEIFYSCSSIEKACGAVEEEVERRKAQRTKFLDDVIGKISTEGLESAMDFYKNNKTSP